MLFRTSIVQLSNEIKPRRGLQDGSLLYEVDTKDIYIFYKGEWYKQTVESGD